MIKLAIRLLALVALCVGPQLTSAAASEVHIAERLSVLGKPGSLKVEAGKFSWVPILPLDRGDQAHISVTVDNQTYKDIGLLVCDDTNLRRFRDGQSYSCQDFGLRRGSISFTASLDSEAMHYLVFRNGHAKFISKSIRYRIDITTTLGAEEREQLKAGFEAGLDALQKQFKGADFSFSLVPCGFENAFSRASDGAITVCSELFLRAFMDQKPGVFYGVLAHELGHTLLNLWGEPNFQNEQVADEFAVAFMILDRQERSAWEWIEWFEKNQDIQAELEAIVKHGDMHPMSIQRINAIKGILKDPHPYMARWRSLFYEHMTDEGLKALVSKQATPHDIPLAKSVLEARGRQQEGE